MSPYLLNFIIFFVLLAIVGGIYYWLTIPKNHTEEVQIVSTTATTTANVNQANSPTEGLEGLKYEILRPGQGQEAKNNDEVLVHYVGTLENGVKFDSSRDRNNPFNFILGQGQVIKGWELGVLGMKVGEVRKLIIPANIGYGEQGTPGGPIPPNATLIFEVELLGVSSR